MKHHNQSHLEKEGFIWGYQFSKRLHHIRAGSMASGKQAGVVMKPVTQQLRAHIHKQEAESTLGEACAFFLIPLLFYLFYFLLLKIDFFYTM